MRAFRFLALVFVAAAAAQAQFINVGSDLQPVIDSLLIQTFGGKAHFQLHSPTPQEVSLVFDEPWEGNACNYVTVFQDGDRYRMYYKGDNLTVGEKLESHPLVACYAESTDGIHWVKPKLGLFDYEGSTENNIVWNGPGSHDFAPFIDANPNCPPETKYKAVANGNSDLVAFTSPDGIHWSPLQDGPIITDGAFDSNNIAFWDPNTQEYRAFIRDFKDGVRDIKMATSNDFVTWTEPVWLDYPGAPTEQLYTNNIIPYFRAPQIYLGFPTRYVERGWTDSTRALPGLENRTNRSKLQERYGMAITDGLFMTSRDGRTFHRWSETFLRPGIQRPDTWAYGDNYQCWGVVTTKSALEGAPDELSIYATEGYWTGTSSLLRRYTLRMDGFVSVHASMAGGEIMTRPLVFEGKELALNFATSAAGSIRVEVLDVGAEPIEGFTADDSTEIFGDELTRVVSWKNGNDLSALSGTPIRLRFVMNDADLYAFQFRP
ncbi:MAG: hypothetical protein KJ060_07015 [Candidatus Hydrogenedentes bacterium]|nr:hypothetical protein [Candidatus Hydrogenedentota bacterium]